jgi:hypothetical protein
MQKAGTDGNALYVTNDDRYLYIAAEIHHGAEKPVINLRVENPDTGETYWYYKQPGGFIYYKQGDHSGIELRSKGDFMEFRIPFGDVMGLSPDTLLNKITIFIQDEANEWKSCGTVTAEGYQITPCFTMLTVPQTVTLREGARYIMRAVPAAEGCTIRWYLDGKLLTPGGDSLLLNSVTPEFKGVYTVRITTKDGTVKELPAGEIADVLPKDTIRGDLDLDGKADAADVRLLTDWLHGKKVSIPGDADLNADGVWDVYDLALLKKNLQ